MPQVTTCPHCGLPLTAGPFEGPDCRCAPGTPAEFDQAPPASPQLAFSWTAMRSSPAPAVEAEARTAAPSPPTPLPGRPPFFSQSPWHGVERPQPFVSPDPPPAAEPAAATTGDADPGPPDPVTPPFEPPPSRDGALPEAEPPPSPFRGPPMGWGRLPDEAAMGAALPAAGDRVFADLDAAFSAAFAVPEPQYDPILVDDPEPGAPLQFAPIGDFLEARVAPPTVAVTSPSNGVHADEPPAEDAGSAMMPADVVEPAVVEPAVVEPTVVAPTVVAPALVAPAAVAPALVAPAAVAPAASVVDTGRGWGIRSGAWGAGDDWAPPDVEAHRATPSAPAAAAVPAPSWRPLVAPVTSVDTETVAAGRRGRRLGTRLCITGAAVAGLGVVGWVGWGSGGLSGLFQSPHSLSRPVSIGTLTRVRAAGTEALVQGIQSRLAGTSGQTVAGVYGTDNVAKLIFVASPGKGTTESASQVTADVNASATPFTAPPVVSTVAGQEYVCGTVGSPQAAPAVICAWTDPAADGFVVTIDSGDVPRALTLATQARAAAEH